MRWCQGSLTAATMELIILHQLSTIMQREIHHSGERDHFLHRQCSCSPILLFEFQTFRLTFPALEKNLLFLLLASNEVEILCWKEHLSRGILGNVGKQPPKYRVQHMMRVEEECVLRKVLSDKGHSAQLSAQNMSSAPRGWRTWMQARATDGIFNYRMNPR